MNKLMLMLMVSGLFLSSNSIYAKADGEEQNYGGFKGEKRSEVDLTDWECEYCGEYKKWDGEIDTHLGFLDENPYHFGNYSGLEDSSQLFLSGRVKMQDGEGGYWNTRFQNIGLDSATIQSAFGKKGSYGLKLDYTSIPVRKFDQLQTPFVNPSSTVLRLDDDWSRSGDATTFTNTDLFSQFSLGTDWENLGISFNASANSNFDFNSSYRRLEKEGIREFSATHLIRATYLPLPVDQITEDFSASIDYRTDKWYTSFGVKISRFENAIESITYASPFSPLVDGGAVGSISPAPDNLATTLIINGRYFYAPKSSVKIRYSKSKLTQDEEFLPYTTNLNVLTGLPQADLNGEVVTQDLELQLNHWFDSDWSFRLKYRNRERDNKTAQLLFQPIVTDLYPATELMNLPYDFSKESLNAQIDFHPMVNQLLSLDFKSDQKTRNFQAVYKTKEEGFTAKYRAMLSEKVVLMIKSEHFNRDGSAPDLIDYLGVAENPLMQRYNVSDRRQDKYNFQIFYSPIENFSAAISGFQAKQDYKNTEVGLTNNARENLNLNFNWQINNDVSASFFIEKDENETELAGSSSFNAANWFANNFDEVNSYGVNFSYKDLLDGKLNILFDFNRSDGDTVIKLYNNNSDDVLPKITSLWSQAELKFKYLYSESLNFTFSYQYHKFESNDFTIDGLVPGSLTNLVTFGALSNNYNVNYLQLSVSYKF